MRGCGECHVETRHDPLGQIEGPIWGPTPVRKVFGMGAKAKTRRTRVQHPGVKIKSRTLPSGKKAWRARWTDPDTGEERSQSLDQLGLTSHEARRRWAIKRSRSLKRREAEIAEGGDKRTETPLREAVEDYFQGAKHRLRPKTISTYREGVDRFVAWTERRGLSLTEELTLAALTAWRESLIGAKRRAPTQRGRRGERHEVEQTCSPVSINSRMRSVKALLNHWRRLGITPKLSRDAIADGLQALRTTRPEPVILRPDDIAALFRAALRHDAALGVLGEAAAEVDPNAEAPTARALAKLLGCHESRVSQLRKEAWWPGAAPWRVGDVLAAIRAADRGRYDPAAPFVAVALMTGMRLGEVLALKWEQIEFGAMNERGEVVGEIRLGVETKTKTARRIDLGVSPVLRRLLQTLKLRAGDEPRVFPTWTENTAKAAVQRLIGRGAPKALTWQVLRRTCGSFLVCSPGIYGAASVFMAAKQLGHSIQVAERYYLGALRGLPREARSIEAAMGVGELLEDVVRAAGGEPAQAPVSVAS